MNLPELLKEYESYHRHPKTHLTHYWGVPMIVFSILGGASRLPLDLGLLIWVLASGMVFKIDWRIGIPFNLCTLALYFVGRGLPLPIHILLFSTGWALQFLGHVKYEGNRPAFVTNLKHLLIAPLWIFAQSVKSVRNPY